MDELAREILYHKIKKVYDTINKIQSRTDITWAYVSGSEEERAKVMEWWKEQDRGLAEKD